MAITKVPSALYGTTVTAGGTNHTKGSYVELTASTSEAVEAVIATIDTITASSSRRFLMDLAVGSAGAESVVMANLPLTGTSFNGPGNAPAVYQPLGIASGSRVAARCQCSIASDTMRVSLLLIGGTSSATVESYGAVTASTNGTQVDPGGSANTKGSYAQLTASTSATIGWLATVITGRGNAAPAQATFELDIATGGAGSESLLVPGLYFASYSGLTVWVPGVWSLPVSIPSGTRIAARGASSSIDATDRLFDVMVFGSSNLPSAGGGGAAQLINGGLVS